MVRGKSYGNGLLVGGVGFVAVSAASGDGDAELLA